MSLSSGPRVDCTWGLNGLKAALPNSDLVIIVDLLSFSTAVDVAVARGAVVFPYPLGAADGESYAASHDAVLAQPRSATGGQFSLSPQSLAAAAPGTRIVLPSPNGSALSRETGAVTTFCGCLRNAEAVAQAARDRGQAITVVAAGERWPDGGLRPALEDWLGAGAIIDKLSGHALTADAEAARAAYRGRWEDLAEVIRESHSGQELTDAGYADDVAFAVEQDVSTAVPLLREHAYRDAGAELGEA